MYVDHHIVRVCKYAQGNSANGSAGKCMFMSVIQGVPMKGTGYKTDPKIIISPTRNP